MQRILGLVRRCVEDYHMIEPGDRVAVGVSGGKDSLLTLAALAESNSSHPIAQSILAAYGRPVDSSFSIISP